MKILKITLQNINSLKSATPIVIDFESEQFKDVGLFAITGSTGAGKTTILDAITIALYHNVPRFNGTKGTLVNVVSHGANDAFSSVTFENDGTIYEAFWSIRIADKTGKAYKNAKEEVSLKNLTTAVILATQKRDLIAQVINVTQLDYNQFLRSVLLAQGEFAAFLSAKGPEKGKLLEQITGEQIYKKIGQGILERKALEEKKLDAIKAKINDTDVLTDETKAELQQKDKTLDAAIVNIEKEITATQRMVNWYAKHDELLKTSKTLGENAKDITTYIEKHKTSLTLLTLHEKAAPFKEVIQEFNRTEKEQLENVKELKILEDELTKLQPIIVGLEKRTQSEAAKVAEANKEFSAWLPKFDLVTNLDSQLKNEAANQQKSQQQLAELIKQVEALTVEKNSITKEISTTNSALKNDTEFLIKNEFLKEVDAEISGWTRDLTTLKADKKTLYEHTTFVAEQKNTASKTTALLQENTKLLAQKVATLEKAEQEQKVITTTLTKSNYKTIQAEKDKWNSTLANWKTFKNLSEQTTKQKALQAEKVSQKKEAIANLEKLKKELTSVKKNIENQEKSVADATKILNLEKSIAKYEDDRKNLVDGEPCGLCGSETHPFAENVQKIDLSESEIELHKREKDLNIRIATKNELEKKEVQYQTTVENLTHQIAIISEELKTIKATADTLKIDSELTETSTINAELKAITERLNTLEIELKNAEKLELQKNELTAHIAIQNKTLSSLKTTLATQKEQLKNTTSAIEDRQKAIDNLTKNCAVLEDLLKNKLAKFNYELPSAENTTVFIQDIEASITKYVKIQQNATNLKAKITVLNTNLSNTNKQLKINTTSEKELVTSIQESTRKTDKLKRDRMAILPLEVGVAAKRTSLQAIKKQFSDTLELSEKELQKLRNSKTEKEALKVKTQKEQKELITVVQNLQATLTLQLKNSDFESKNAIEPALLSEENSTAYKRIEQRIKENKLKLKTLKDENSKAIMALEADKNFKSTATESKQILERLNIERKDFSTEKGKILEAYRKDSEIRNRNKDIYKKIDLQEAVCSVWKELFKIIGNSKDAFNVYVQRLTLKHLLDLANVHLYKLNKRYSLKMEGMYKPKEELNFNLIDHYQTDQVRLVDTSSGGEKFIISLALALGLSDLASKNVRIDSLFIDEGFGTLDKNTLETVISTLETLQSQGKTIGIISHVENLKERIATQIKITKKSNGVSVVHVQ